MSKIVIGFSKPQKWKIFSWLIQTGLNIPYDHVYVKLPCSEYDRQIIYQASGFAVNFMSAGVFNSINTVVKEFEVDVTDINRIAMIQFAIDNAGKPYSAYEIIGMTIVRAAELCGFIIKNPLRNGDHAYVCSELVSFLLEQYDSAKLPKNYQDMTPKDIYDFMNNGSLS